MDLMRSSIKVLFHDFSLDAVADSISKGYEKNDGRFKEYYIELMKWRETGFTSSEVRILYDWFSDNMLSVPNGNSFWNQFTPYEKVFLSLEKCGCKLLRIVGNDPKVAFENLLRWRDLTLLTGEDLIILPTLAKHDIECQVERKEFCWPNVLGHDNIKINDILKRILSDTHAHLWASADVFEINWMIAMNHPEILMYSQNKNRQQDFLDEGMHQSYDKVNRFSPINRSLREWIIIAATLRMRIYQRLYNNIALDEAMDSKIFESVYPIESMVNDFTAFYESISDDSVLTTSGFVFDYAIREKDFKKISEHSLHSPYMIMSGERKLLYDFFYQYFGNKKEFIIFAPIVYLYVLIKNKIRREIIQTNELVGFENFQSYQNLKLDFVKRLNSVNRALGDKHKEVLLKFAFQSAILGTSNNNFEARITPDDMERIVSFNYHESIFGMGYAIPKNENKHVSFIVHFIKRADNVNKWNEGFLRHSNLRKSMQRQVEKWKALYKDYDFPAVGFDAAGSELNASPEVFAPTFKQLRNQGHSNFTFHAGEDFYDLIHGLRSIDEAIELLNLTSGCRLGHALALGVDAKNYYESRHFTGILPKQILLDNLIWLKYTAMEANVKLSPKTELLIEKEFVILTDELKYNSPGFSVTMYDYWLAMRERGSDPLVKTFEKDLTPKHRILLHYWKSQEAASIGAKVHGSVDFTTDICHEVVQIQLWLMRKIEDKGIVIETNPSSNVKIGPFSKYSDLPLFRLHPIGTEAGIRLPVTVNTDDKGVFATSLENEYSLVALALRKIKNERGERKWNDKEIEDYLKQLADYSNMTRFCSH